MPLVVLIALAFPSSALAATVIGQLDPGPSSTACVGASYWVEDASAGPFYAVPADGVITSWSHKANVQSGRKLGLRIFRLVSGTTYMLVGSSGVQTLTASTLNSFTTRIPVKAGDRLGLYVGNPGSGIPGDLGGGASCGFIGTIGDLIHQGGANPEPAVGSNVNLPSLYTNTYRLNVTAAVEADADGDGYGDETQDGCPGSAAASASCPQKDGTPPKATVLHKRDSGGDGSVSVIVTADEAATATASGAVGVPGAAKVYKLKSVTTSLQSNVATKLKLRVPKNARKPIRRALKRHRKLKAKIQIVLKDAAGNAATVRPSVSLRR